MHQIQDLDTSTACCNLPIGMAIYDDVGAGMPCALQLQMSHHGLSHMMDKLA